MLLGSLPVTMALLRLSLLHHKVSQSPNERPQPLPLFDLISCDDDEITIPALNERQVQIRRWAIIQQQSPLMIMIMRGCDFRRVTILHLK